MKMSYRQGVFETNSSSIHSISVGVFSVAYGSKIYDGDDINIVIRNYYKGPEILRKPEERASYLLALVSSEQENMDSWKSRIKERFELLGAGDVTFSGSGNLYSSYKGDELLVFLKGNIELDNFLFGDTVIFVDSDEAYDLDFEVESCGMSYDKDSREFKRSQFRIV